MGIHICTIAARNYLPFVRTLAASFAENHPDGTLSVLIIDDIDHQVSDSEPFEVLRLGDLGPDVVEFHRMAMIYDITEFATALKPWLLEMLLGRGWPSVLYLDPDIRIYSSIEPLAELAGEHGLVLTPHADTPLPLDGKKTDDRTILAAGIYNLGFVGVSPAAQPFLDFWKERLKRQCVIDPSNMRFVDQRWVDFAPGHFDHRIIRDPQYNVAYWNLHGRTLRWSGKRYEVNGVALAFFHFSGYSTKVRHLLSKHQGDNPRILLSEHPDLARLCDEYAAELIGNGADEDDRVPYGLLTMADGTPIDKVIRHLYRDWLERTDNPRSPQDKRTPLPPDPFDPAEVGDFIAWLARAPEDDGGGGRLNLYLATMYSMRPDLHGHFPDPQGEDHRAFMNWAREEAIKGALRSDLVHEPGPPILQVPEDAPDQPGQTAARSLAGRWAPPDRLRPGIVVAGYLNAELGIGQGARLTVQAVEASGIPFTTVGYQATNSRQQHPFRPTGPASFDLDTNIVVVNADQFDHFASEAGRGFFEGRYTIAQWAWELEEFPASYVPMLARVNEVWAVSTFSRDAIAASTDKPVFAFPHPIVVPSVVDTVDRSSLGLPDGFLFLFCFDMFSVLERKNPIGLIDAFCRAFEPGEGPTLVLKAINGNKCLPDLELIRWAIKDRSDIVLIDRYLDHDANDSLMAMADCYVSLHRSEGFGLTMAEAMALGKPVIATGYSGNMDFMTNSTAYLVPFTMTTVPPGSDPYPAGAHWADPDLGEAARLMRSVVEHPADAVATGERGRRSVLSNHGIEVQAEFVRQRFAQIQHNRATQLGHGLPGWRTPADLKAHLGAARAKLLDVGRTPRRASTTSSTEAGAQASGSHPDLPPTAPETAQGAPPASPRSSVPDQAVQRIDELERALALDEKELHERLAIRDAVQVELQHAFEELKDRLAGRAGSTVSLEVVQASIAALRTVPDMGDPQPFSILDDQGRPAIGYRKTANGAAGYAGFEDVFRGPETLIRQRLEPYLPLLRGLTPVVDAGCGRGEMLDLLAEHGIPAEGIDNDPSMVARTSEKGHAVIEGDAVEVLRGRPDQSIGAVVSIQVVEHLPLDALVGLLSEARRVLEPGGLLLAETMNPHALHAFKAFWTDLTHRSPIFPEVLVAYCREAGFDRAEVIFPGGTGDLDEDRWTCGDYAVIARVDPV